MQGKKIKIATIDTLLNQYLAFLYTNRPYFNDKRILCISEFMFTVQQRNRLKQKGLLRRFNIDCYGNQTTLEDIRSAKTDKYEELKHKRGTKEWEEYFLRYQPAKDKMNKTLKKKKRKKRKSQTYNILGKIES